MRTFKAFFAFEFKNRLRKPGIVVFSIVTLLFIFFVQDGINRYFQTFKDKKTFQETEETKVDNYVLMTQYGAFGLRLMFLPPSFSILYSDSLFEGMLANVNTTERLNIYKQLKGRGFFDRDSDFMNVLGLLLLFGALFDLIYGYDTTRNREYLKFLSTLSSPRKVFFGSVSSRIVLLNLALFVSLGISLLWALPAGINLFRLPLLVILAVLVLVNSFFFTLGCIFGALKSRAAGGILLASVYFVSLFLFPWLANKQARAGAADIQSLYEFELENVKIMMAVEKRLIDKYGIFKSGDIAPDEIVKAVKEAVNTEFKELRKREDRLKAHILKKILARRTLSCFFPVTFYISHVKDVCGQGGLNFIAFYSYSQDIKEQFIDFYVEKKFLSKNTPGDIESFVKNNENLYYAQSLVDTRIFLLGAGVGLLYIFAGLGIAYFLFLKNLFPRRGKVDIEEMEPVLAKGVDIFIHANNKEPVDYLYTVFSREGKAFSYVCGPDHLPGEPRVNTLLHFFEGLSGVSKEEAALWSGFGADTLKKSFNRLDPWEKLDIVFRAVRLRDSEIYLFNDIEKHVPFDSTDRYGEVVRGLKESGKAVIRFGTGGCVYTDMDRGMLSVKKGNRYTFKDL